MHISEGVLSGPVLLSGAALAVAGTAIGLKKLDYDQVAKVGMLSAAFFVASLIHVPIGPSNAHLILNGLVGLLLGWAAFPAILVALVLQAVLFQFGIHYMQGHYVHEPEVVLQDTGTSVHSSLGALAGIRVEEHD